MCLPNYWCDRHVMSQKVSFIWQTKCKASLKMFNTRVARDIWGVSTMTCVNQPRSPLYTYCRHSEVQLQSCNFTFLTSQTKLSLKQTVKCGLACGCITFLRVTLLYNCHNQGIHTFLIIVHWFILSNLQITQYQYMWAIDFSWEYFAIFLFEMLIFTVDRLQNHTLLKYLGHWFCEGMFLPVFLIWN